MKILSLSLVLTSSIATASMAATPPPLPQQQPQYPQSQYPQSQYPQSQYPQSSTTPPPLPSQPGSAGQYPGQNPAPTPAPSMYPQNPGYSQQPQQPQYPQPNRQPGFSAPGQSPNAAGVLQQLVHFETQDFGVPATNQLHRGAMHGRTPNTIPGGRLLTTQAFANMVQQRNPYVILDVLGGPETLPGALPAARAAQPGSYTDQIQQQFSQMLQQATRGNKQTPIVLYCQSVECWMSYNASLRAIQLGYSNVLWYRGGISAWKQAGFPVMPAGGGYPAQQPGGYPQGAGQQPYPTQGSQGMWQ